MSNLFSNTLNFNEDISNWNTSNVTNMSFMFAEAGRFNQPVHFDTNSVLDMDWMFFEATTFNQNLNNWDTDNVHSMRNMFQNTLMNNMNNLPNWYQEPEDN